MTSDNERALEDFDECIGSVTYTHAAFRCAILPTTYDTIRKALQRDDSVVEEMVRALEFYADAGKYPSDAAALTSIQYDQGYIAKQALAAYDNARGKK